MAFARRNPQNNTTYLNLYNLNFDADGQSRQRLYFYSLSMEAIKSNICFLLTSVSVK